MKLYIVMSTNNCIGGLTNFYSIKAISLRHFFSSKFGYSLDNR